MVNNYYINSRVLKEGIEFSLREPILFGKIFLRLERDFDRHALYFRDEPTAQAFLSNNDESLRFFNVSLINLAKIIVHSSILTVEVQYSYSLTHSLMRILT